MNSVIQQIRAFKAEDTKYIETKAVIGGCSVRMRFANKPNIGLMELIQEMLISSYIDSMCLTNAYGARGQDGE
ncbi:MAG: hypothetical protein LBQ91_05465 [Oscillospiraceae bacterium]|jgi:hypothetical protein|nr:hypothetical protein [Oscillospiraceae bacterium]